MSNVVKNSPKPLEHTAVEDFVAILTGAFIAGFGVLLLKQAAVASGGTVGLSVLLYQMTGWSFGLWFFVVNLPFYYLGYRRLGRVMVVRTVLAVATLSVMTELHPHFVEFERLEPAYVAVLANIFMGLGLLILFRHGSSLGGFNLLALDIQDRYQIPAGKVQLGLDSLVLVMSLLYLNIWTFMLSIVGVVILNVILTMNFRKDRYIGS